ncbi:AMP-binding protein, partial [Oryctes borbonicus]
VVILVTSHMVCCLIKMAENYLDSIELPDEGDNIIRTRDLNVVPNPAGFGYELFTHLKKHGDKVAQIDAETGITENFNQYFRRILRVALHLKERGVKPGDVVAPCTSNHLDTGVVFVAPLLIGAQVACFDPNALYADTKFLMDLIRPKVMFASEEAVDNLEKVKAELNMDVEIVVFGPTKEHTPFEEYLKPFPKEQEDNFEPYRVNDLFETAIIALTSGSYLKPFPKEQEDNFEPYRVNDLFETAIIALTSGSTGTPKGLCMSHFVILSQFGRRKSQGYSIAAIYSPIVWISGQLSIIMQIIFGNPRLICDKFTPENSWRYLTKYKANSLTLSSQDAMLLLKYGNPERLESPYLLLVVVTGGKMSVENMSALSKIFLNRVLVVCPYGQSEIYGVAFSFDMGLFAKNPATAGKPIKGFWYKV